MTSGATHDAARVAGKCGEALWMDNRVEEAIQRMDVAYAVLEGDEPDRDLAWLASQIARFRFFHGELDEGFTRIEQALRIAEDLWLPDVIADAMNTKSLIMSTWGRNEEAIALLRRSIELAQEHDIPRAIVRAATNLSYEMDGLDRIDDAMAYAQIGIDTCRRLGFVSEEWFLMQHVAGNDLRLGRWDELLEMTRTLPDPKDEPAVEIAAHAFAMCSAIVYLERGESVEALAVMDRWVDPNELDGTGDAQLRLVNESLKAIRARAQGNDEERLRAARSAFQAYHDEGISHGWVKWAFEETIAGGLGARRSPRGRGPGARGRLDAAGAPATVDPGEHPALQRSDRDRARGGGRHRGEPQGRDRPLPGSRPAVPHGVGRARAGRMARRVEPRG